MNMRQLKNYFGSRTGRLAMTYLAIIMAMTIAFSAIIFSIASRQFDRPLDGRGMGHVFMGAPDDIKDLLDQRADDARAELLLSLLFLNFGMLGFGVWLSNYLAQHTMAPIERAMQEQVQFVSDASHELRTPLTALTSLNEVVLRRKGKITDTEARDLAAKNVAETSKLYALTTSLLGLVHVEQQMVVMGPVDLQRVVGDAMEHIITTAQEKKIIVEDATPKVMVLSQAERLTQVVKILLENAIKYSHKNSTVRLHTVARSNTLTLFVSDAGVGIDEKDLPHIFNRFYRADQSRNKQANNGYGIGLAIAKTISDRLDMNIQVKSKVGKGSTFSIDLPLVNE